MFHSEWVGDVLKGYNDAVQGKYVLGWRTNPDDDLTLERIVAFWRDGTQGLYIHPGIWHEGVCPVTKTKSFQDRQGRVHARVSCNICTEFGVFLKMPLLMEILSEMPSEVG